MQLIIGLGNPGKKYTETRHNIGFVFTEKLKAAWDFPDFEMNTKFNAEISKKKFGTQDSEFIILVKPWTFMNNSGDSVRAILDFYKLAPDDIIVIHDDLDIALGEYRIATDSSSAGHNGVQDIIDKLGTQKFKRIRIGIGRPKNIPGDLSAEALAKAEDYVLQKFSPEEMEKIESVSENILEEIKKPAS